MLQLDCTGLKDFRKVAWEGFEASLRICTDAEQEAPPDAAERCRRWARPYRKGPRRFSESGRRARKEPACIVLGQGRRPGVPPSAMRLKNAAARDAGRDDFQ